MFDGTWIHIWCAAAAVIGSMVSANQDDDFDPDDFLPFTRRWARNGITAEINSDTMNEHEVEEDPLIHVIVDEDGLIETRMGRAGSSNLHNLLPVDQNVLRRRFGNAKIPRLRVNIRDQKHYPRRFKSYRRSLSPYMKTPKVVELRSYDDSNSDYFQIERNQLNSGMNDYPYGEYDRSTQSESMLKDDTNRNYFDIDSIPSLNTRYTNGNRFIDNSKKLDNHLPSEHLNSQERDKFPFAEFQRASPNRHLSDRFSYVAPPPSITSYPFLPIPLRIISHILDFIVPISPQLAYNNPQINSPTLWDDNEISARMPTNDISSDPIKRFQKDYLSQPQNSLKLERPINENPIRSNFDDNVYIKYKEKLKNKKKSTSNISEKQENNPISLESDDASDILSYSPNTQNVISSKFVEPSINVSPYRQLRNFPKEIYGSLRDVRDNIQPNTFVPQSTNPNVVPSYDFRIPNTYKLPVSYYSDNEQNNLETISPIISFRDSIDGANKLPMFSFPRSIENPMTHSPHTWNQYDSPLNSPMDDFNVPMNYEVPQFTPQDDFSESRVFNYLPKHKDSSDFYENLPYSKEFQPGDSDDVVSHNLIPEINYLNNPEVDYNKLAFLPLNNNFNSYENLLPTNVNNYKFDQFSQIPQYSAPELSRYRETDIRNNQLYSPRAFKIQPDDDELFNHFHSEKIPEIEKLLNDAVEPVRDNLYNDNNQYYKNNFLDQLSPIYSNSNMRFLPTNEIVSNSDNTIPEYPQTKMVEQFNDNMAFGSTYPQNEETFDFNSVSILPIPYDQYKSYDNISPYARESPNEILQSGIMPSFNPAGTINYPNQAQYEYQTIDKVSPLTNLQNPDFFMNEIQDNYDQPLMSSNFQPAVNNFISPHYENEPVNDQFNPETNTDENISYEQLAPYEPYSNDDTGLMINTNTFPQVTPYYNNSRMLQHRLSSGSNTLSPLGMNLLSKNDPVPFYIRPSPRSNLLSVPAIPLASVIIPDTNIHVLKYAMPRTITSKSSPIQNNIRNKTDEQSDHNFNKVSQNTNIKQKAKDINSDDPIIESSGEEIAYQTNNKSENKLANNLRDKLRKEDFNKLNPALDSLPTIPVISSKSKSPLFQQNVYEKALRQHIPLPVISQWISPSYPLNQIILPINPYKIIPPFQLSSILSPYSHLLNSIKPITRSKFSPLGDKSSSSISGPS